MNYDNHYQSDQYVTAQIEAAGEDTNYLMGELESLQSSLAKEDAKNVNEQDFDYILLLEKSINRLQKN
jgi:hypothetical protein|tara:strand:+ start:107 stop:310 length:204 start_codon:yes stop_codon:yes gene_type:complete